MTTLPAVGGRDLARYLPIVAWLPRYRRSALPRDLIAAITVWALVVPQAIAYAQIAGLPPQQGLFAAAGGLLGYGLMGTCRQLIVSPTSSTAAISASLVGAIALGDVTKLAPLSSALAILCGVTFVLLGLLRLGFVSRFIPAAVQVGFMFGLGMTIIVGQLTKILGVPESSGTFLEQTRGLLADLGDTNLWTVALGVVALALLLGGPRRAPGLPWALIVVVGGIVAVALLGLADKGVAVIGLVDGAFPLPAIPAIAPQDLFALVPGAIAIAVVGSAESLTVAQSFAEEHRYEIDPDQELRANGAGNLVSGLLQGFIVGGGASQSAAAERAGASSPIVSLMVAALTVITSVALLPLFQDLPQPVLGAIVISAVIGFLRVAELRRIAALRRDAFLLALVALGATLVLGILSGLIVTVLLALVLLLASFARPEASVMGQDPSGELVSLARVPGAATLPGVLVLRLDAPLLFLNAGTLHDRVSRASTGMDPRPSVVVLDLSMSADLDIGSLDVLGRLDERLRNEGAELRLVHVHRLVQDVLARAAALGTRTPPIYATMADAVDLERGGAS
ncbi:MAG: SulP family inorganic anion transporter [Chloroflexota bacterium]